MYGERKKESENKKKKKKKRGHRERKRRKCAIHNLLPGESPFDQATIHWQIAHNQKIRIGEWQDGLNVKKELEMRKETEAGPAVVIIKKGLLATQTFLDKRLGVFLTIAKFRFRNRPEAEVCDST